MLKSVREITNQLDNIDRYIRQQKREFLQLKDSLRDLHARKKKLVDNYNKKRQEYVDWSNRNKKNIQGSSVICSNYPYPATYHEAHCHQSCEFPFSLYEFAYKFPLYKVAFKSLCSTQISIPCIISCTIIMALNNLIPSCIKNLITMCDNLLIIFSCFVEL